MRGREKDAESLEMTRRRKPVFLDEDLDVVYDEPLATMRKERGWESVSE